MLPNQTWSPYNKLSIQHGGGRNPALYVSANNIPYQAARSVAVMRRQKQFYFKPYHHVTAANLRNVLESAGIACEVRNDRIGGGSQVVVVDEDDGEQEGEQPGDGDRLIHHVVGRGPETLLLLALALVWNRIAPARRLLLAGVFLPVLVTTMWGCKPLEDGPRRRRIVAREPPPSVRPTRTSTSPSANHTRAGRADSQYFTNSVTELLAEENSQVEY